MSFIVSGCTCGASASTAERLNACADEIRRLQPGWDGYGAPRIPLDTVDKALIVCAVAGALTNDRIHMAPMSNCGILIEFEGRDDLSFEVDEHGRISVVRE